MASEAIRYPTILYTVRFYRPSTLGDIGRRPSPYPTSLPVTAYHGKAKDFIQQTKGKGVSKLPASIYRERVLKKLKTVIEKAY